MATYYAKAGAAGSNAGTQSDPWQSVADMDTSYSEGDIVNVAGTFVGEQFCDWDWTADGVTFQQWDGEDPWIMNCSGAVGHGLRIPNSASGTIIDGIEIYSGTSHGIRVNRCVDVIIKNAMSHDNTERGLNFNESFQAGDSIALSGIDFYNNTQAVDMMGVQGGTITISKCTGHGHSLNCFSSWPEGGSIFYYDCVAYDNSEAGFHKANGVSGQLKFFRCKAYNNGEDDAVEGGFIAQLAPSGFYLENCLAYNNYGPGIWSYNTPYTQVQFCTVYGNDTNIYLWGTGNVVENTIMACPSGGYNLRYDHCTGVSSDYNCIYDPTSWSCRSGGDTYNSLASWQSSTSLDQHSIDDDPMFTLTG